MIFVFLSFVILTCGSYFLFVFGHYILGHDFSRCLDYVVLSVLCTGVERSLSYPDGRFLCLDVREL